MPETRILLVEDDPDVRNILSIILEGEGYTVDTAATVDEAIKRLDGDAVLAGYHGLAAC
jgi:CheY-like chemotaxis protein